jgi:hypothetical protein
MQVRSAGEQVDEILAEIDAVLAEIDLRQAPRLHLEEDS